MTPDEEPRPGLAEAVAPDLIILAVSLAVQLAALGLLANRDALHRGWMRLYAAVGRQRDRDRMDVAVASFRRDMTAWEHEQAGR